MPVCAKTVSPLVSKVLSIAMTLMSLATVQGATAFEAGVSLVPSCLQMTGP